MKSEPVREKVGMNEEEIDSPVTHKSGVCGHFGFIKEMVSFRAATNDYFDS